MKIALIADIHGNKQALDAVLADIEARKPDKLLVLGDLVFKGASPQACVQTVRKLNTVVLQGNIDELVGKSFIQPGFAKSPSHEEDLKRELAWTREQLSEEELEYLAELPFAHEEELAPGIRLRCVHANPHNLLDIVLPSSSDEAMNGMFDGTGPDVKILAYGHIHQPYVRSVDGRLIVNTGSVGLSFDGNTKASYAWIEAEGADYSVSIRRVAYDLEAAVRAYEGSGHPFAESVIAALRAGRRPV